MDASFVLLLLIIAVVLSVGGALVCGNPALRWLPLLLVVGLVGVSVWVVLNCQEVL